MQRIADANGGNRSAGSPGEAATAAYIERTLRAAGYRVERERFAIPATPRVTGLESAAALRFSPAGDASGVLRAVGLGCATADFADLGEDEIALARRGTCEFREKARLAEAAGASALVVVNSEDEAVPGTLGADSGLTIPVVGVASGDAPDPGERLRLTVETSARRSVNVIAESGPPGARVAMAGGHLDSVPAGAGMNDNASGVAALLHVAQRLGGRDLPLRFGFWGAEEIGLVGSREYVEGLPDAERERIGAYVNLDMVGSPGAEPAVYDGDARIERALRRELGADAPQRDLGGASDHASFAAADIPVGGIFTGLDECYHERCDRLANVDREVLAQSAAAAEGALVTLARR